MGDISRVAAVRQTEQPWLQGHRRRDGVLQAAGQSVRRDGALAAPDPAAAELRPALHRARRSTMDASRSRATSPRRSTGCRVAPRRSPISPPTSRMRCERAWVWATLKFGDIAGPHGPRGRRDAQDAAPSRTCSCGISREFDRIKPDELPTTSTRSAPARRRQRSRAQRRHAIRRAGGAGRIQRGDAARRRWASRRRSSASPSISPSRRAAASSTRSSAATRRSARSSTS